MTSTKLCGAALHVPRRVRPSRGLLDAGWDGWVLPAAAGHWQRERERERERERRESTDLPASADHWLAQTEGLRTGAQLTEP